VSYDFNKQLSDGEAGERYLDDYFNTRFEISKVNREGQRRGIDRVFKCRETGKTETIEYKTDKKAQYTHNAFIETVSVDTDRRKGWAYTCTADLIFYYVPGDGLVYVLEPTVIRRLLPLWAERYPTRKVRNNTYYTHGICVPLRELEACAREVISNL